MSRWVMPNSIVSADADNDSHFPQDASPQIDSLPALFRNSAVADLLRLCCTSWLIPESARDPKSRVQGSSRELLLGTGRNIDLLFYSTVEYDAETSAVNADYSYHTLVPSSTHWLKVY